jgi:hypothetical protein
MLKHLDYLMISNGGCDPFHYLKGRGGLGYKPSHPYMHGLGYDYNLMDGGGFNSYKNMSHLIKGRSPVNPDLKGSYVVGQQNVLNKDDVIDPKETEEKFNEDVEKKIEILNDKNASTNDKKEAINDLADIMAKEKTDIKVLKEKDSDIVPILKTIENKLDDKLDLIKNKKNKAFVEKLSSERSEIIYKEIRDKKDFYEAAKDIAIVDVNKKYKQKNKTNKGYEYNQDVAYETGNVNELISGGDEGVKFKSRFS